MHRYPDLEPRGFYPMVLVGVVVAWLFVGITVYSLLVL